MKKKKDRLKTLDTLTRILSRFGIRIVIYAALAVLFYVGITKAYAFGYSVFTSDPISVPPGTDIVVTIEDGMDSQQIAELLKEKGVIRDEQVFTVQELLYTSKKHKIYPGTYTLNTSWGATEIIDLLTKEPETTEETTALAGAADAAKQSKENSSESSEGSAKSTENTKKTEAED